MLRDLHEQRSFWANADTGIHQDPAQRVLAIRSLAALGANEALPLLIEWAQDGDANISAAASSAILAILQRAEASK